MRVQSLNHPAPVLFITAGVYVVFLALRLWVHGWDASYFVTAGDLFSDPARVPSGLHVQPNSDGHDGQFYYRLALNPFSTQKTEFGITLDLPSYRQQRILYPLVVWALSLGRPEPVPILMIVVNYVALGLLAWFGARYVQACGHHALWGLIFPGYPGLVLSLARDFTEIPAMTLVVLGLLLLKEQRRVPAVVVFTLGVFARETTVLVPVAWVAVWLAGAGRGDRGRGQWVYLIPPLSLGLWQLALWRLWGQFPAVGTGAVDIPFRGFVQSLASKAAFETPQQIGFFIEIIFVAAFAVVVTAVLRSSAASRHEKTAWVLYALLVSAVSHNVWSEDWSFLRNLCEFHLLGAVILLHSRSKLRAPVFAGWGGLWLLTAVLRTDLHHLLR
jgi:hypothetical protein